LILDAAAIDDLPARCPASHGFARVSAWRLIFAEKSFSREASLLFLRSL